MFTFNPLLDLLSDLLSVFDSTLPLPVFEIVVETGGVLFPKNKLTSFIMQ